MDAKADAGAAAGIPWQGPPETRESRNCQAGQGNSQAQVGARHIERNRSPLRQRVDVKFDSWAKRQVSWPVRLICEALDFLKG